MLIAGAVIVDRSVVIEDNCAYAISRLRLKVAGHNTVS